jgi:hypothetical protein
MKVELIYSVPRETYASWVNLCADGKGRLFVSDQSGRLYRLTPPAAEQKLKAANAHPVPAKIRSVNGTVWAFNALYVGVNDYEQIDFIGVVPTINLTE